MYCPECGAQKDESKRFCPKCGFDFQNEGKVLYEAATGEVQQDPVRKVGVSFGKTVGVLIAIFSIAVIGIVTAVIFFVFRSVSKMATAEYIDIAHYEVSSFYKVSGKKYKVCSTRETSDGGKKTFVGIGYCETPSEEEINEYFNYLVTEEEFIADEQPYSVHKGLNGNEVRVYYSGGYFSYSYNNAHYDESE